MALLPSILNINILFVVLRTISICSSSPISNTKDTSSVREKTLGPRVMIRSTRGRSWGTVGFLRRCAGSPGAASEEPALTLQVAALPLNKEESTPGVQTKGGRPSYPIPSAHRLLLGTPSGDTSCRHRYSRILWLSCGGVQGYCLEFPVWPLSLLAFMHAHARARTHTLLSYRFFKGRHR